MPLLVKTIMKISDRVTEYAAGELLSLCSTSCFFYIFYYYYFIFFKNKSGYLGGGGVAGMEVKRVEDRGGLRGRGRDGWGRQLLVIYYFFS